MTDTKNDLTNDSKAESNGVTRRKFIKNAAVGGAGFMIVPRYVLGRGMTPPSDLLNIAGVGIGGMGRANLIALAKPSNASAPTSNIFRHASIKRPPAIRRNRKHAPASTPQRPNSSSPT
jgi:hypothetical protein